MDSGLTYFLLGLPAWTPWPAVIKAHRARRRLHEAINAQQKALDDIADGKVPPIAWGNLDDVSDFIMARHAVFRKHAFTLDERADVSIAWAVVANAPLLVYWQLLHILATPGLATRIREEVSHHVRASRGVSIGKISETPKLSISHEGLSKECPLFKASYFEACRLCNQPWSVKRVASDVVISGDKKLPDTSFIMHKGEFLAMPHELHMRDPKFFKDPEKFVPDRFLVADEYGKITAEMGTIRPYGGGATMCKGRIIAERECLALVAGVLVMWDIEPADRKTGWVIPAENKATAVSVPAYDTRVKIKRRRFEWEDVK